MELDFILDIIEENGYLGLFLWLWFGVVGMPVPNEIIAMTVGLAASLGTLNPVCIFLSTYLGIVAALTTSYLAGKYIGVRLLPFFRKSKRMARTIDRSFQSIEKYHAFSLLFSYFIPGLRNFVPFIYGLSKLSYKVFALFAYSGAFIWLSIVFSLGYWFGDQKEILVEYETELLLMGSIVFVCAFLLIKVINRKKVKKLRRSSSL
ncbi:DedA family protein [Robertmurraya sp. GLU-23]